MQVGKAKEARRRDARPDVSLCWFYTSCDCICIIVSSIQMRSTTRDSASCFMIERFKNSHVRGVSEARGGKKKGSGILHACTPGRFSISALTPNKHIHCETRRRATCGFSDICLAVARPGPSLEQEHDECAPGEKKRQRYKLKNNSQQLKTCPLGVD